ncbi:VOC family protein [Aquibacillus sediminis]|uniref:VOC family protein n=1 Tax=Aquibacillus sediminis TaxID=2574734 RepID=UPI0011087592|nr:VOC family protein [Aquibacillus sediminis]
MESKFFREPNTYVEDVMLKVLDLKRSLEFYQNILGFQILEQKESTAKLTADGEKALIHLEQPTGVAAKQGQTTGLYHFAILVPNRLELAKILKHFVENNVRLGASDHLVSEALYLNDPDGNGIEVYHDRPSSVWKWENDQVAMTVDPLDGEGILAELNGEKWEGLHKDTVMGHIHLHVSDLNKAREFYGEGLGFDVVCKLGSQAIFISTGSYHHHIGLNTWAGEGAPAPSENSAGMKAYTLVFSDKQTREDKVKRLRGLNYHVEEKDGTYIAYDPSENCVVLAVN